MPRDLLCSQPVLQSMQRTAGCAKTCMHVKGLDALQ